MYQKFISGNKVRLISTGKEMTVVKYNYTVGDAFRDLLSRKNKEKIKPPLEVICEWEEGGKPTQGKFMQDLLELA